MGNTSHIDIDFPKRIWEEIGVVVSQIKHPKKHISIILHKNKIISIGANVHHTKPIATRYGYSFGEYHSELDAIIKIKNRSSYKKLTLINFRFNRLGEIRMSRPCIKCMRWCRSYFDRIIYSHEDAMIYEMNMDEYSIFDHSRQIIPESCLMPIDIGFRAEIMKIVSNKELSYEKYCKVKKIKSCN